MDSSLKTKEDSCFSCFTTTVKHQELDHWKQSEIVCKGGSVWFLSLNVCGEEGHAAGLRLWLINFRRTKRRRELTEEQKTATCPFYHLHLQRRAELKCSSMNKFAHFKIFKLLLEFVVTDRRRIKSLNLKELGHFGNKPLDGNRNMIFVWSDGSNSTLQQSLFIS